MENFQKYYHQANKLFEFKIKVANVDLSTDVLKNIKNALDAYQVETISKPKRMPIQEHREFPSLGPCECQVIDVAVKYPTIVEQIRQLIITRAMLPGKCVTVYTKDQFEQEEAIAEKIDSQKPVLENPELESNTEGQKLVGEKRNISLLKELETRKYEISGSDKADGKTTNELPQGTASPVGSNKAKMPTIEKGSVR